jgi:hypothetical protein
MRLHTAATLVGICFAQPAAQAQDRLPDALPPQTLVGQVSSIIPTELRMSGDRLIFLSAGAVFVAITMNFMSGGMIATLVNGNGANVPTLTIASFALSEISWHGTVWGLGPATILSVGQPVDAALRDGFATPSTYAGAVAESGRRARALVDSGVSFVGATVGGLWNRL